MINMFSISHNAFNPFNYIFWEGFMPYQQYFSYLMVTVHKSMFPGLFLTSTQPVYYLDTSGPVVTAILIILSANFHLENPII